MAASVATPLQDERFLVLDALGQGGMARVYRAFDRIEQRMVALKVQHRHEPGGPAHPLAAEFEAWSRLDHPNIVRALELGHSRSGPFHPRTPYLVLEHVDGRPLADALRPGRETSAMLERVAVQLLQGLAHVHIAGYVHRDLKPSNVLVARSPRGRRFKLTDFGLAVPRGRRSEPGRISGSLPFVSPEALLGLPLDGRSDLYGLGILLFQLAVGELPAPRAGPAELLRWHLSGPEVDPGQRRPDLSDRLARFIRRLCARRREDRPADACRALEQLGVAVAAPQAPAEPCARRAERAALRLALDAVRLGALRVLRLPGTPEIAEALRREMRIWSQVHGLEFQRVAGGRSPLARAVLQRLLQRSSDAERWVEAYRLRELLPLRLLGGLPVLDQEGAPAILPGEVAHGARRLAAFLIESAAERSAVLDIDPAAMRDPLVAAVVRRLQHLARQRRGPRQGRGGLLLLCREPLGALARAATATPVTD